MQDARPEPLFDLYSPELDSNPFPLYERLREEAPAYWCETGNIWILTRYEDVSNATIDWQTFSSQQGNLIDEIPGRAGATLGSTDPPRHDRLRALSQAAFLKRNTEHLAEPIRQLADTALDAIVDKGTFDFVTEYSSAITVPTLLSLMGLPARDPAEIRRKVILSISTDKSIRGRSDAMNQAFYDLGAFLQEEVENRRRNPAEDLITHLAQVEVDGERLSDREIVMTSATFVMAGIESLSSFMTMLALNLHDYPDARRRITANPALMAQAIEESLRFNTSAQRFKRTIARPITLHGQDLKVGDKVALCYGSANRDWRKFPNPDVYDLERKPQGHMGFGGGKHFCLGSQMARFVTGLALGRFLQRVPEFHMTDRKLEWISSSNFRSPTALRLAI